MREILETEEHVPVPPIIYSDPFYRITYLIKEEIRKYKWIEGEKGRKLSWERARQEWTDAYRWREDYEDLGCFRRMTEAVASLVIAPAMVG